MAQTAQHIDGKNEYERLADRLEDVARTAEVAASQAVGLTRRAREGALESTRRLNAVIRRLTSLGATIEAAVAIVRAVQARSQTEREDVPHIEDVQDEATKTRALYAKERRRHACPVCSRKRPLVVLGQGEYARAINP